MNLSTPGSISGPHIVFDPAEAINSGPVAIQPDVTCISGKNESGKTAVLQALRRFNPAQPNVSFNAQRQYPAWLEKQHRNLEYWRSRPHGPLPCYLCPGFCVVEPFPNNLVPKILLT